jgi:hypothetical protein
MTADRNRPHARGGRPFSPAAECLEDRKLMTIDFKQGFYAVSDKSSAVLITLVRNDGTQGTANQDTEQAQLTVGGGTATAGVDYEPVNATVTFGPGQTSQTIAIPIMSHPGAGTKVVHLTLAPSADVPHGAAAFLSIMHGPDLTPPQVASTNLLTKGAFVTGFQIKFNKPMDPTAVQDVSNYAVQNPKTVRHARGAAVTTAAAIPLQSANYDPATNTVTLVPAGHVRKSRYFEIESSQLAEAMNALNGAASGDVTGLAIMSPITDTSGNALDSNADGIPDGQLLVFAAAGRLGQKWNSELAKVQTNNMLLTQL